MNQQLIKEQTINWIKDFILNYNICPFAKKVIIEKTLEIKVFTHLALDKALESVIFAIDELNSNEKIETTLLVFANSFDAFDDYLDFAYMAEELLSQQGYDGIYQLATFHPKYCFADVDENDVSNYTNKSPYPMLHILREKTLDKVIDAYGDTNVIPQKNINTMKELGLDKLISLSQT